jgi:hypothetical protein
MNRRDFIKTTGVILGGSSLGARARAQAPTAGTMQPVLKRSYDLANSCVQPAETKLTSAYVSANGVRLLGTLQMTGDKVGAESQPLVVPSVMMPDGFAHDIAVLTDMAGNCWCWDANTFQLLWKQHLVNPILGTTAIDAWNINQFWSFVSSGVIDTSVTPPVLYAVGWQSPDGTADRGMHYFHAINLNDGSQSQAPIDLASISFQPPSGPVQNYNATMRKQRSSLTMATIQGKKTVMWAAGTVAETSSTASGWIFACDVATKAIVGRTFSNTSFGAGIWMGGGSVSVDAEGNIYLVTGNGTFDGANSFGECAVRLSYTPPTASAAGSFAVDDWFCPYDDRQRENLAAAAPETEMVHNAAKIAGINGMTANLSPAVNNASMDDQDLGSSPGTLIESLGLFLVCGKDGVLYPVKMSDMGKTTVAQLTAGTQYSPLAFAPIFFTYFPGFGISPDPMNPAQLNLTGLTRHLHSGIAQRVSPTHGQMVFCAGENSPVRAWSITATGITFLAQGNEIASAQTTHPGGGMPGMQLTVCNDIIVASCPYNDANQEVCNGRFLIYDAENLVNGTLKLVWDSQQEGIPYLYNKFCPPVISGGKILLNSYQDAVLVLG